MTTVRVRSSGRQILRLSRSFITVFLTVFILHEIVLFSLVKFQEKIDELELKLEAAQEGWDEEKEEDHLPEPAP